MEVFGLGLATFSTSFGAGAASTFGSAGAYGIEQVIKLQVLSRRLNM